jgi:hypothetical protein
MFKFKSTTKTTLYNDNQLNSTKIPFMVKDSIYNIYNSIYFLLKNKDLKIIYDLTKNFDATIISKSCPVFKIHLMFFKSISKDYICKILIFNKEYNQNIYYMLDTNQKIKVPSDGWYIIVQNKAFPFNINNISLLFKNFTNELI